MTTVIMSRSELKYFDEVLKSFVIIEFHDSSSVDRLTSSKIYIILIKSSSNLHTVS